MTTKPAPIGPLKHFSVSDVRGFTQLAIQATSGVTRIAEGVHFAVLDTIDKSRPATPGLTRPDLTRNITRVVYETIHQVTQLVGATADITLGGVQALLEPVGENKTNSVHREAALAILNGVIGDRLLAGNNTLAVPMSLHCQGQRLEPNALPAIPAATGKVLLQIHGLCMSDVRQPGSDDRGHDELLASELGYTPVSLRYNSGLHISLNGRELSAQLEQLLKRWPAEVEGLTIVAHSMGGLVARSAIHYARQESLEWADRLKNIVFLGTPHHGAPLEQAGNWVDSLLRITPYTRPFGALGQLRSAGITDLRNGNLLDEDWCDQDRFHRKADARRAVPLPDGVACYTVAGMAARRNNPATRLLGDGLVPLRSALGQHDDSQRALKFEESAQHIAHGVNHLGMLNDPGIKRQIVRWLADESAGS